MGWPQPCFLGRDRPRPVLVARVRTVPILCLVLGYLIWDESSDTWCSFVILSIPWWGHSSLFIPHGPFIFMERGCSHARVLGWRVPTPVRRGIGEHPLSTGGAVSLPAPELACCVTVSREGEREREEDKSRDRGDKERERKGRVIYIFFQSIMG